MNDYWIKRVSELEEEVNFLRAYKKKANETIQNLMSQVERYQGEVEELVKELDRYEN
jgi:predicted  nucleic acid-binding Zn-ribbon protein